MKFTTLAVLASVAIGANAQTPAACVLTCSQQAATAAGCASFADPTCVCTNVTFQNSAQQCIVSNCTPEEQAQALSLQAALCPNGVVSGVSSAIASSISAQISSVSLPSGSAASSISASVASSLASTTMMTSSSAAMTSSAATQGVVSSIASSIASAVSSQVSGALGTAASRTSGGTQVPAASSSAPANGAKTIEAWGMGGKVVAGVVGLVGVGGVMAFGF